MKTPREKFKAALRRTGLNRSDIAACVGINRRSLENVLSGAANRKARQRVTDLIGVQLWEGVRPTQRIVIASPGVEFDFAGCEDGEKHAKEFAAELGPDYAKREGCVIKFVRPIPLRVGPIDEPASEATNLSASPQPAKDTRTVTNRKPSGRRARR